MRDISNKPTTFRQATARATVKVSKKETIEAVINKTVPKGDVFEMAKTAGFFAVKRTPDIIPDCHPIPIEHTEIKYDIQGLEVIIEITVKAIYKTGVEVEAMHGASVVALTMYDMLKPIDKEIEICSIKLLSKKGGKTDFHDTFDKSIKTAVVVMSDSVAAGKKEDKSGKVIKTKLESLGLAVGEYIIIPDEPEDIRNTVISLCDNGTDLIVTTGGTGLSPRDKTPEALKSVIKQEIPGIMEAARNYGQQRTPYAMLSRGIAGMRGKTLIVALPGSSRGADETMEALFPSLLHIFKVLEYGYRHQGVGNM